MKVKIEIDDNLPEEYVTIHCKSLTQEVLHIQELLMENNSEMVRLHLEMLKSITYK